MTKARYIAVWVIAILNMGDIVSTYVALSMGRVESNPLAAFFLETKALIPLKIFICAWLIFGAILARQRRQMVPIGALCAAWFVAGVYGLVVVLNTIKIFTG